MVEMTARLVAWTIAFIILSAVVPKLSDIRSFSRGISAYRVIQLVPSGGRLIVAVLLIVIEVVVALQLLFGAPRSTALAAGSMLFAGYALASATELKQAGPDGRADCACLGSAARLTLGWTHVTLNGALALGSVILAVIVSERSAIDGRSAVVVFAAAMTLGALYWLIVYAASVRLLVEDAIAESMGTAK